MQKVNELVNNMLKIGYSVHYFDSMEEAVSYLEKNIYGVSVGFGDSQTLIKMDLANKLKKNNIVADPSHSASDNFLDIAKEALTCDVFLTSVNAVALSGEMVNIDGTGNRIAGSLFGHKKVFFVFGMDKVEPTLEQAIKRAREIEAPKNAKRLQLNTPCALSGNRCYDCSSSDRICNAMVIYFRKMQDIDVEVIVFDTER